MMQRRPHWDADLINAVRTAMRPRILTCADTIDTYDVVAAVEDWLHQFAHMPEVKETCAQSDARARGFEDAVQRVRELCDAREEEENDNGGYGKAALVPISDVRDILEVHE